MARKSKNKWQFGDFQTPKELARKVVQVLKKNHTIEPNLIIEPTCGKGTFINAALEGFPNAKILGFDINQSYVADAIKSINSIDQDRVSIEVGNFFTLDWNNILQEHVEDILILGNPPWVTSSELSILNSKNLPVKSNFQNHNGVAAITGAGNFDISEWMLLQYVNWLSRRKGAIALLCKYSVARKVMKQIRKDKDNNFLAHIYFFNAKQYFSASVEACLFVIEKKTGSVADCKVYDNLDAKRPVHVIGSKDGYIIRDVTTYQNRRHLKGKEPLYLWRSGLKHDCAKIMELTPMGQGFLNGLQEYIELEQVFLYPCLKSSDIGNARTETCRKMVIVTQTSVGEDTTAIKHFAPKTWLYLKSHSDYFVNRKSSVYKNKPLFAIFGVGEYTFKKWKIAISSLYKRLNFCLVGPLHEKPVVFDDTVNFLSFDSKEEAAFIYELLSSEPALEFYNSMIFWDNKRPITTDILRRLSLKAVAKEIGREIEYENIIMKHPESNQLELEFAENIK